MLDLLVGDVVEYEELGLGAEVRNVGDAALDQVALGLLATKRGSREYGSPSTGSATEQISDSVPRV